MASKARNKVVKLAIHEVSAVDEPGDDNARMVIIKSRQAGREALLAKVEAVKGQFSHMADLGVLDAEIAKQAGEAIEDIIKESGMDEEIKKALEDAETRLDTLEKANEALAAENADLKEEIAKGKAAGGEPPVDDEAMLKSLPEPMRKRLAAADEAVQKLARMEEKAATDEAIAKAKGYGVANAEDFGPALARILKGAGTPEDGKALEGVLTTLGARAADAALYKSLGVSAGPATFAGNAQAELDSKVEAIQKAKPGITREQAEVEAYETTPGLYDAITKRR